MAPLARFLSLVALLAGCAPAARPAAVASTPAPALALDFWLGDWDVTVRARSSPDSSDWKEARGTNHVTAPLGRCVVLEQFHADGPGDPWNGTSVSTYVPQLGVWRRAWVGAGGSYLAFRGGVEGDAFVLYGEPRPPADAAHGATQMRMAFRHVTPDALDWSWERGTPGGATWTPVMEIHYARQRPAPAPGTPCDADASFHDLDFWLGDWTVVADGKRAGQNRIEKILGGCAVVERWRGADGGEGQSLFYHPPGSASWTQVWLTPRATSVGGAKEKRLVLRLPGGGLRFQGELPAGGGGRSIFDRTTLEPLEGGRVRQRIEISRDRGASWTPTFDAVYERAGAVR